MKENTFSDRPVVIKEAVQYAPGSIVSRTLIKRDTGTLTLFAFDAGEALSEHTAPFDTAVWILDGRAEVTIGGKTHMLGEGEFIIMPADVPHAVMAPQRFKMLLVMIKG